MILSKTFRAFSRRRAELPFVSPVIAHQARIVECHLMMASYDQKVPTGITQAFASDVALLEKMVDSGRGH